MKEIRRQYHTDIVNQSNQKAIVSSFRSHNVKPSQQRCWRGASSTFREADEGPTGGEDAQEEHVAYTTL